MFPLALWAFLHAEDVSHRISVAQAATTTWTRVCAIGTVTRRRREPDGDWHLRVEDGGAFLVAEIMPEMPMAPPRVGDRVDICGITRYDKRHHWPEIHPVTSIQRK